ncbi:MAG: DUF4125 family protein [Firmicutes bacterium]|nr:DUF4125 family protein [Bacillota bacterium]
MGRGDVVLTRDNREFIRQDCLRDALIYEIVDLEWSMMQDMRSAQGRPLEESGFEAFYQVRYSQHSAMNSDTVGLYKQDLMIATHTGRNLMAEKYGYMKDPSKLPEDPAVRDLIGQIVPLMLQSQERFSNAFPALGSMSRAFDPEEDQVSLEVYITSELVGKSDTTLQMILRDVKLNPDYIRDIFEVFVSFFGQDSLGKAEVLAAAQQMKPCRGATL